MDRALRAALLAIGCVIGAPVAAFLVWDAVAFRPHLAEINRILARADPEDRQLTPTIHRLLDANVDNVPTHVGSMLCLRLDPKSRSHGTRVLWALATKLHFDADQRHALLATLAWNGTDNGLDRYARRTYGRALSELTDREAARVVAWTHGPGYYRDKPKMLELRAEFLLRQSDMR